MVLAAHVEGWRNTTMAIFDCLIREMLRVPILTFYTLCVAVGKRLIYLRKFGFRPSERRLPLADVGHRSAKALRDARISNRIEVLPIWGVATYLAALHSSPRPGKMSILYGRYSSKSLRIVCTHRNYSSSLRMIVLLSTRGDE